MSATTIMAIGTFLIGFGLFGRSTVAVLAGGITIMVGLGLYYEEADRKSQQNFYEEQSHAQTP